MSMKKIFLLAAGVLLMAAGCSKTSQTPVPPADTQPVVASLPAPTPELDPQRDWIRFYPSDNIKLNLLFPLSWWGDEGGTDTHFVLRSRKGANGTNVDDVIMDFTIGKMTAQTLAAQAAADMKGAKDTSPVTAVKTDTGVPYAFATYIDKNDKPTLGVAVQYLNGQYIQIKITGNVTHPYVGRMIQSLTLTQ